MYIRCLIHYENILKTYLIYFKIYLMMHSQLLEGLKCESQIENNERIKNRGTLPDLQHFGGVEGCARARRWD
jgi:hypothetical protein